jgi:hypothetical protein
MEPCDHSKEDVCGCGTFDDAMKTAMGLVKNAFAAATKDEDGGMCLLYQCMVSYAVFCISTRGLILQIDRAAKESNSDIPDEAKTELVTRMVDDLKRKMAEHMAHSAVYLEKSIHAVVSSSKRTPFAFAPPEETVKEPDDGGTTFANNDGQTIH